MLRSFYQINSIVLYLVYAEYTWKGETTYFLLDLLLGQRAKGLKSRQH